MSTVYVKNALQAAIFPAVVQEIVKGHFRGRVPFGHETHWMDVKVEVNPDRPGRDFEPAKDSYNLLHRDVVATIYRRASRAAKQAMGYTISPAQLRHELRELMDILRTPVDGVKAERKHRGPAPKATRAGTTRHAALN